MSDPAPPGFTADVLRMLERFRQTYLTNYSQGNDRTAADQRFSEFLLFIQTYPKLVSNINQAYASGALTSFGILQDPNATEHYEGHAIRHRIRNGIAEAYVTTDRNGKIVFEGGMIRLHLDTIDLTNPTSTFFTLAHEVTHAIDAPARAAAQARLFNEGQQTINTASIVIRARLAGETHRQPGYLLSLGNTIDVTATIKKQFNEMMWEEARADIGAYNTWVDWMRQAGYTVNDQARAQAFPRYDGFGQYYSYPSGALISGLGLDANGHIVNNESNWRVLTSRELDVWKSMSNQAGKLVESHPLSYMGNIISNLCANPSPYALTFNANELGMSSIGLYSFEDFIQAARPFLVGNGECIIKDTDSGVFHTLHLHSNNGTQQTTITRPPIVPGDSGEVRFFTGSTDGLKVWGASSVVLTKNPDGSIHVSAYDADNHEIEIDPNSIESTLGSDLRKIYEAEMLRTQRQLNGEISEGDGPSAEITGLKGADGQVLVTRRKDYTPTGLKASRDPNTGIRHVLDWAGREVTYQYDKTNTKILSYTVNDGREVTVLTKVNASGDAVSTEIALQSRPPIEFSQAGEILGQQLGSLIVGSNRLAGTVASAALKTFGNNLGDALDGLVGGQSGTHAVHDAFKTFDTEFLANLKAAGTGALSAFLTAELIRTAGIDGIAGEFLNTTAGTAIGTIVSNLAAGNFTNPFAGVTLASLANAAGSYVGTKLASSLVSFGTIGGQIGAAFGSSIGSIAGAAIGSGLGPVGSVIGSAVGAFVGDLVGGAIGSVFGGTPRSSASLTWSEGAGEFVVGNVSARKGGSKDLAEGLAQSAANTLNAVLYATGATLLDGHKVEAGSYGMRKTDFVYAPSQRDEGFVDIALGQSTSRKFSGKDGAEKLISYGAYEAFKQDGFILAGGDVIAKRAFYNTLAISATDFSKFDLSTLLGNIAVARQYSSYLENASVVNTLISEKSDSLFAADWAVTLAKADELGLQRRSVSDWYGGYGAFLNEYGVSAAEISMSFSYDSLADRLIRTTNFGFDKIGDTVPIQDQLVIKGSDQADIILLGGTQILASTSTSNRSLTLNGAAFDGQAHEIDVTATIEAGEGNDFVQASDRGDNVLGGTGDDTLYGGRLDDWLLGGAGNDVLHAGSQAGGLGGDGNYLEGDEGDDRIYGAEGSDWLEGNDGVDILEGGAGDDILAGGSGDGDILHGGRGDDQYLLRPNDGADTAEDEANAASPGNPALPGDAITQRFERLRTHPEERNWAGGEGGGVTGQKIDGGEDAVVFGEGIDLGDVRLSQVNGTDLRIEITRIDETTNTEVLTGTQLVVKNWFSDPFKRVEWLRFADGNAIRIADIKTFIVGTSGDDVLNGTSGADFVYGGSGDDQIRLYEGDDIGSGGTGNDIVWGDEDKDLVVGGLGDDKLFGGSADDMVSGDDGNDELDGDAGDDILSGGRGDDTIFGGSGTDTIKFSRGDGRDTVLTTGAEYDGDDTNWEVVWSQADGWNTAHGYSAATVNEEFGGKYDYDQVHHVLRRYIGADGPLRVESRDSIEFDLGIDLQDVSFLRSGSDLTVVIGREDSDIASLADAEDAITITDWYLSDIASDWRSDSPIGTFAFYQTGLLQVRDEHWTLIAGTGGADGTEASPLAGTTGQDWITGGSGADVIAGGAADDILNGNGGFDSLHGEAGQDILYGGDGDDVLEGGAGADVIIGGAGSNAASYASALQGVVVHMSGMDMNQGDAAGDVFSNIDRLIGSKFADHLGGDSGDNELSGGGGVDVLLGGAGNDTYFWNRGDGASTIREGDLTFDEVVDINGNLVSGYAVGWEQIGDNTQWFLTVTDADGIVVYEGEVQGIPTPLPGPRGLDGPYGPPRTEPSTWPASGWTDGVAPGEGQRVLRERLDLVADGGDDVLEFGAGISLSNLSFIQNGDDLIILVDGSWGSSVWLKDHFTAGGQVETLQFRDGFAASLKSILLAKAGTANLYGGVGDDLLVGDDQANSLAGFAGNDVLSGGAGADILSGWDGDDVLEGGAGADTLSGSSHSDPSKPGWGDTARYASSSAAVNVDLRRTGAQSGGDAAGDVLNTIENVTGSAFNDILDGDDGGNRLDGLDGANSLHGWGGDDVLVSGAGADMAYGGDGDDGIAAGAGNDQAWGGAGRDRLDGGDGDDSLQGEAGDDVLTGGAGIDTLSGGDGNDQIYAGAGNDSVTGGVGNDEIGGEAGDDSLMGGAGDDRYYFGTGSGADRLTDSEGANVIAFGDEIAPENLWFSAVGTDLRIGVIGTEDAVFLSGFFATAGQTRVRAVQTQSHTLYLDHPDTLDLISAMIAQGPVPAAMPAAIASLLSGYWHAGGKAAPTVAPGHGDFATAEDVPLTIAGTQLGVIDHDQNIVSYRVKDDAAPLHGQISWVSAGAGSFVYTPNQNYWGQDRFSLIVTDADGQAAEIPITVTVAAVNDAPDGIASAAPLSVAEGAAGGSTVIGTVVGQFTAVDAEGDPFSWSLADSANGRFQISAQGLLTVANASLINYEAASSLNIRVRATDSGGAAREQIFSIAVGDVNEANSLPASFALSVSENSALGTFIATIAATDPDLATAATAKQNYYFLNGSVTSSKTADGLYSIDRLTGAVKVAAALSYEALSAPRTYSVVARDNDGAPGYYQAVTTVKITVKDVNETNSLPAAYNFSINENSAAGTVAGTVVAADADLASVAFGQQRYYFLNGTTAAATSADGRYSIDPTTGAIKAAAALDYESMSAPVTYTVIARDNAGAAPYNQASTAVTIGVADVNEAPAAISWSPLVPSIAERDRIAAPADRPAIALGTFAVSDIDGSSLPSGSYDYSVSDSRFEMIGAKLWLKAGASLDFEAASSVALTVTAKDRSPNPFSIQRSVTITVTDVEDVLEGDSNANLLVGQQNRDRLYGFGGDDTLDGGAGADLLVGGAGNDVYFVDNSGDSITENAGEGTDLVKTSLASYTLAATLENLSFTGTGGFAGTGNAADNALAGSAGADTLAGLLGNDVLTGGSGADSLDGGDGIDTAAYDLSAAAVTVDLLAGTGSGGDAQGDVLTAIENAVGGSGGDALRGNALANLLDGGAGDDDLDGRGGDDVLRGGLGGDILRGGTGADSLDGGAGIDTATYEQSTTAVTVDLLAGTGIGGEAQGDVLAAIENVTGSGANDILRGNAGDNLLRGGAGDDVLEGRAGNDSLEGGLGNDSLDGGTGSDMLIGGVGDDVYIVDAAGDAPVENAGEGSDEVRTALGVYALGANLENLLYTGTGAFTGTGNALNNRMTGGAGADNFSGADGVDTLTGNGGDDSLSGGLGADTMVGGVGNDSYYVDDSGDVVTEGAGEGTDTVYSALSTYALGANVENLTVYGTIALIGTGNALDNIITGGVRNDTLDGGAGADTLIGGSGNDIFVVENVGDLVKENAAEGTDTVRTTLSSYALGANVENLSFTGTGGFTGTGNGLDNLITGGAGNDLFTGGGGADQFVGAAGTDTASYASAGSLAAPVISAAVGAVAVNGVTVAAARTIALNGVRVDLVAGSGLGSDAEGDSLAGIESLVGSAFGDQLRITSVDGTVRAGAGDDLVYGAIGNDQLYGESGNDVVYGDAGADQLFGGDGDDRMFGDGGTDFLYGEAGNDILAAGDAGDVLDGGAGNDILIGGNGGDTYRFDRSSGADVIYNYDDDAGVDAIDCFYDSADPTNSVKNTDLWFTKSGKDLVVKLLGGPNKMTIKDWFSNAVAGDWTAEDGFFVDVLIAGTKVNDYKVNMPTLLSLMKDTAEPAAFSTLSQSARDQIDSAWGNNTAPTIAAASTNPASALEDSVVQLKFVLADLQSPGTNLTLKAAVAGGVYQPIQPTDIVIDGSDPTGRTRILTLRPIANAHGLATVTVTAFDGVLSSPPLNVTVRALAVADATLVTAPLTFSTSVGSAIFLPGSLAGGRVAAIADTDSEVFNYVKIESVPVGAVLSDGVNSFTSAAGATTATVTTWNLATLRVTPPAGSPVDFTMTLKAASRENLTTAEINPGGQFGPEASTTIKVVVNSAPSALRLGGLGPSSTPLIQEATSGYSTAGRPIGVVVTTDADSLDGNLVATDFTKLPTRGLGEERIVTATGPTGSSVQVLETGQLATEATDPGGGVYGVAAGAPDLAKAYKYTIYVKAENGLSQYLYVGATGSVENAATGAADGNPYFWYGLSSSLVQDRWYRVEGYILPAGSPPVGGDVFGGVYDTVTGDKIANTTSFRFAPGATSTGIRFFSYYGQGTPGYSAQWYQPQVEKLDYRYSLVDDAGGRFTINTITGQVSAAGNSFDYETAASHKITVRTTDGTGLFKDQDFSIAVGDTNEANSLPATYSMMVQEGVPLGSTVGQVAATDPDTDTFGQQKYYFLNNGVASSVSSDNRYMIESLSGLIMTNGPVNYATMSAPTTYTVVARDNRGGAGYNQAATTVTVSVSTVNHANSLAAAYSLAVAENVAVGTAVATVTATDPDSTSTAFGQQKYYFLAGGVTSLTSSDGRYAIDSATGSIRTNAALNYETAATPTSYTVIARDNLGNPGYFEASTTVTIAIGNVNEANALPTGYAFGINENSALGTVVGTVAATDADSSSVAFGQQRYYFFNNGVASSASVDNRFVIDATTGTVRTNAALDYETMAGAASYTIVARDNLGAAGFNQAATTLTINVNNVNEAPNPIALQSQTLFSETLPGDVAHGGQTIAAFGLSDPDGTVPTLAIVGGNQNNWFSVSGGRLIFTTGVNFTASWFHGTLGQYGQDAGYNYDSDGDGLKEIRVATLTLAAVDAGGAQSTPFTYNVLIEDKNEAPNPLVLQSQTLFSETLPGGVAHSGQTIAAFGLSDPDGTIPSLAIVGGNQNNWFSVSGGRLVFATGVDFSASWLHGTLGQYGQDAAYNYDSDGDGVKEIRVATLTLAAVDSGGAQSTPFTYNVLIEDKNEAPNPIVLQSQTLFSETLPGGVAHSGQTIATFGLSDPDGTIPSLAIVGGNQNSWFSVSGGRLVFTSGIDFSASWLHGTLGQYGQDAAYNYDSDGDGLKEIRVATLTLAAVDAAGVQSTPFTYNVLIEDKNEAPAFNAGGYSFALNEDAPGVAGFRLVGNVAGSDVDGPADQLRYGFAGGTATWFGTLGREVSASSDGMFIMDILDGRIWSNAQKLDYETTKSFTYQAVVSDRSRDSYSLQSTAAVTINLQNLNDTPPQFGPLPATFTVMENTPLNTRVAQGVVATDPDGFAVSYSIDPASNPNGAFAIDAAGQIYVAAGVDYEAGGWLQDSAGKYANLTIVASDGGPSGSAVIQVRIGNQVLQVTNAAGTLTGRFRVETTSDYRTSASPGGPRTGPTGVDSGEWYTRVQYIDNQSGSVVLTDEANGTGPYSPVRPLPDPAYAILAPGFRWTGNGRELVSDDEYFGWSLAPIVFDLSGTGLARAFGADVSFDVDGAGHAEKVQWLDPRFGFLALDRNGDGRIGSGLEISFAQDKPGARTDLEGLAAFDSNGDGILSAADARFADFRIWQDLDGNAISEAGELATLAQLDIVSISLAPAPTVQTLSNTHGNVIVNTASFARSDGSVGSIGDAILRPSDQDGIVAETALAAANSAEAPEMPKLDFTSMALDRRLGKYAFTFGDGGLSVAAKKGAGTIDDRAGLVPAAALLSFRGGKSLGFLSTLVLDLDGDGVALQRSKRSKAAFDMDGNGVADETGWTAGGEGFLVLDLNKDGRISSGAELSFLTQKTGAATIWDALGTLDSDKNGLLDSKDSRFADLKLWIDRNGNGATDAGELESLGDMGIASISLGARATQGQLKAGRNAVIATSTFTRTDGSTATVANAMLSFKPSSAAAATDSFRNGDGLGSDSTDLIRSLRRGIEGDLLGQYLRQGNKAFEFDRSEAGGPQTVPLAALERRLAEPAAGELSPSVAGGGDGANDLRLARMIQQMAGFGVLTDAAETLDRRPGRAEYYDYFAS
jgi:Ca2+-binding RTX toxin-like protein